MKLASYQDGSRDGQLVVVSRDLSLAHFATGIATRLQQVLDDWGFLSPQLEELSIQLNHGKLRHAFAFDPRQCLAPLPRTGLWAPAGRPFAADAFAAALESAHFEREELGPLCGASIAAITGEVPMLATPERSLESVRLLSLANVWRLRALPEGEPVTAFAPVVVTPDELGSAWVGGRVTLVLQSLRNGRRETDAAPHEALGPAIARMARCRRLRPGAIIGAWPSIEEAEPLQFGDSVRIEVKDALGVSVFGAIEQDVLSVE